MIGAGTAGLVVAAGAAGLGLGLKVALIEKHLMGGDCLNVGCVPSKCVIRSARVVGEMWNARDFGVNIPRHIDVDFPAVMERMRKLESCALVLAIMTQRNVFKSWGLMSFWVTLALPATTL